MKEPMVWQVTTRRKGLTWGFSLYFGRKKLRAASKFTSQAEAAFAAGRATQIEAECRNVVVPVLVMKWNDE